MNKVLAFLKDNWRTIVYIVAGLATFGVVWVFLKPDRLLKKADDLEGQVIGLQAGAAAAKKEADAGIVLAADADKRAEAAEAKAIAIEHSIQPSDVPSDLAVDDVVDRLNGKK